MYIDLPFVLHLLRLGLLNDYFDTLDQPALHLVRGNQVSTFSQRQDYGPEFAAALKRWNIQFTEAKVLTQDDPAVTYGLLDPTLLAMLSPAQRERLVTLHQIEESLGMPELNDVQDLTLENLAPDTQASFFSGKVPTTLSTELAAQLGLTRKFAALHYFDQVKEVPRNLTYRLLESGEYRMTSKPVVKIQSGREFSARDAYQALALASIMGHKEAPSAAMTVIEGPVGSGKTLLALMGALHLVMDKDSPQDRIFITRPPVGIDQRYDVGFLPGDIEEKLNPWVGGIISNLEFIFNGNAEKVFEQHFKHFPVNMAQGYSIHNAVVIVDEAQLLSRNLLRQLATRIAAGSKLILLCDAGQNYGVVPRHDMGVLRLKRKLPTQQVEWITLKDVQRSDLTELFKDF